MPRWRCLGHRSPRQPCSRPDARESQEGTGERESGHSVERFCLERLWIGAPGEEERDKPRPVAPPWAQQQEHSPATHLGRPRSSLCQICVAPGAAPGRRARHCCCLTGRHLKCSNVLPSHHRAYSSSSSSSSCCCCCSGSLEAPEAGTSESLQPLRSQGLKHSRGPGTRPRGHRRDQGPVGGDPGPQDRQRDHGGRRQGHCGRPPGTLWVDLVVVEVPEPREAPQQAVTEAFGCGCRVVRHLIVGKRAYELSAAIFL